MTKVLILGSVLPFLLVGYGLQDTFGKSLAFLWYALGVWMFGSFGFVYGLLKKLKIPASVFLQKLQMHHRRRWAVVLFLCGTNGFCLSAALIGQSTCDCCEREHPNAAHTYPLLGSNKTLSKVMNNPKILATLATAMIVLNFVSLGLTGLSMLYGTLYMCAYVLSIAEKFKASASLRK